MAPEREHAAKIEASRSVAELVPPVVCAATLNRDWRAADRLVEDRIGCVSESPRIEVVSERPLRMPHLHVP